MQSVCVCSVTAHHFTSPHFILHYHQLGTKVMNVFPSSAFAIRAISIRSVRDMSGVTDAAAASRSKPGIEAVKDGASRDA